MVNSLLYIGIHSTDVKIVFDPTNIRHTHTHIYDIDLLKQRQRIERMLNIPFFRGKQQILIMSTKRFSRTQAHTQPPKYNSLFYVVGFFFLLLCSSHLFPSLASKNTIWFQCFQYTCFMLHASCLMPHASYMYGMLYYVAISLHAKNCCIPFDCGRMYIRM